MKSIQSQAGFTLVELITVILILGILAATALPKFMNVTEQAHEAGVAGVGGALGSAVALAHAQFIANGHTTAQVNLLNFGDDTVNTNTAGWPVRTNGGGTGDVASIADCNQVWTGVMQNPPPTTGSNIQYAVTVASPVCTYTYQGTTGMDITYDSSDGTVCTDTSTTTNDCP